MNDVRICKSVFHGYVDEFDIIRAPVLIRSDCAQCFVSSPGVKSNLKNNWEATLPKGISLVALLELHFLFERQVHSLASHVKHALNLFVSAMVL